MTVETATYLSELNPELPTTRQDLLSEGDDHIRLIKSVYQTTLPNFNSALEATPKSLNDVVNVYTYSPTTVSISSGEGDAVNVTAEGIHWGGRVHKNLKAPFTREGDEETLDGHVTLGSIRESLPIRTDFVSKEQINNVMSFVHPNPTEPNPDFVQGGDEPETLEVIPNLMNKLYPIGHIYTTLNPTNPAEFLGVGPWIPYSTGRILIGEGTTTDARGESRTALNLDSSGARTHKVTNDELPPHSHSISYPVGKSASSGSHSNVIWAGTTTRQTSAIGGGQAHNNLQPYVTVFFWRRVEEINEAFDDPFTNTLYVGQNTAEDRFGHERNSYGAFGPQFETRRVTRLYTSGGDTTLTFDNTLNIDTITSQLKVEASGTIFGYREGAHGSLSPNLTLRGSRVTGLFYSRDVDLTTIRLDTDITVRNITLFVDGVIGTATKQAPGTYTFVGDLYALDTKVGRTLAVREDLSSGSLDITRADTDVTATFIATNSTSYTSTEDFILEEDVGKFIELHIERR